MKTTISALLIPIIGALVVTLASCSSATDPGDPPIPKSTVCPFSNSVDLVGQATKCPR